MHTLTATLHACAKAAVTTALLCPVWSVGHVYLNFNHQCEGRHHRLAAPALAFEGSVHAWAQADDNHI
jgi:hypothetical protein